MLAQVLSAALVGIDALAVSVEADVAFGLPVFAMVGLPDASVRESRDRVRAAIRNSGFDFPAHRITVNLSPADVRKAGAAFDLPIAVAILAAAGTSPRLDGARIAIVGELSLDGAVLPTRGVLPIAAGLCRLDVPVLMLPAANAPEATLVRGLRVVRASIRRRPGRRRIWPTRAGSRRRNGPSRSPRPAAITCCWSGHPAPARRCSPAACRECCRRWPSTKRSTPPRCTR
jgi:hypothetical protein